MNASKLVEPSPPVKPDVWQDIWKLISSKQHVILEAHAGTGKTFQMEHLYVGLLRWTDTPVEKILVVTYTEKATAELRERLRKRIETLIHELSNGDDRTIPWKQQVLQLRRALFAFDAAPIHTIHGFCHRVLHENAFLLRRLFDQAQVDAQVAFRRTFRRVLRRCHHDPNIQKGLFAYLKQNSIATLENILLAVNQLGGEIEVPPLQEEQPFLLPRLVQQLDTLIREELRRDKFRAGYYDFADMIHEVRRGLQDETSGLRTRLRNTYTYAIVDEFQDTDEGQWEIFRSIFVTGSTEHRLFVVGDPKQAIYAFRGADVKTYLAAVNTLEKAHAAQRERLRTNFRSTPEMIAAYNKMLEHGFFSPENITYVKENQAEAGRRNLRFVDSTGNALSPIVYFTLDQEKLAQVRHTYGQAIAKTIVALLRGPRTPFQLTDAATQSILKPSDIFILTGTNKQAETIAGYLRECHVPFAFYKQEGLFQTLEAQDLYDLLAALADPTDRSRRLKALHTPFFAYSLADLPALADSASTADGWPVLEKWHGLAQAQQWGKLFSSILDESGLPQRLLFASDSEREITNYRHLCEILLEMASAHRYSIEELAQALRNAIDKTELPDGEDVNVQRVEAEREAVQIMTIHKSKGLEAKVVFLYAIGQDNHRVNVHLFHKDGKRKLFIGKQSDANADIKKAINAEREHEAERLAYVALTRAQGMLVLPMVSAVKQHHMGLVTHKINQRLKACCHDKTLFKEGQDLLKEWGTATAQVTQPLGSLRDWEPTAPLPDTEITREKVTALLKSHPPRIVGSFTSLRDRLRAHATPPMQANIEEEEKTADENNASAQGDMGLPAGQQTGLFLHALLEEIPPNAYTRPLSTWKQEVEKTFEKQMRLFGIPSDAKEYSQHLVYRAMTHSYADKPLCQLPMRRELEFVYPWPENVHPPLGDSADQGRIVVRKGFLKGSIDVLFKANKCFYLLDWKSNLLPDYAPSSLKTVVEEKYEWQLAIYTLALVKILRIQNEADFEDRVGGMFFVFLRGLTEGGHSGIVHLPITWSAIRKYEEELRAEAV